MPKTPDKTINDKFFAFKYRFNELVKEKLIAENRKRKENQKTVSMTELMDIAKNEALAEQKCHIRYDDDIVAVGNRAYFKSKVIFFDMSGEEISAQSVAERLEEVEGTGKTLSARMSYTDFTEFSRRWAFFALIGIANNSKPIKEKEFPEEFAIKTFTEIYNIAYEDAVQKIQNDASLPFSNVSKEKEMELMIKNCPAPVQTPKFNGEAETGGVPSGFKEFKDE